MYTYLLLSYILGSIPFSVILCKLFKKTDIRQLGSGNIGASNAYRELGACYGLSVFLLDFIKSFAVPYYAKTVLIDYHLAIICGFFAFLGHIFPIFLMFRGGKGVTSALSYYAIVNLCSPLLFAPIWISILLYYRYASLASLVTCAIITVIYFIYYEFLNIGLCSIVIYTIIFVRHRSNVKAMLLGKEIKI